MPRERTLTDRIRLTATRLGARLFRNNVGVAKYPDGSRVKYGLCTGSSDLIGWTPVTITPAHIGQTLAVFTAVEVKTPRVRTNKAQRRFLAAVADAGGIAIVARDVGEVEEKLTKPP